MSAPRGKEKLPSPKKPPHSGLPRNVRTGSDDFLLGDVIGMNLAGEFEHGRVRVFVGVRINVGLQRLQLIWKTIP